MPISKHLKIIMDEMARRVGLSSFDDVDQKDPGWYCKHTWTSQQEYQFRRWLIRYLKNKEAFRELSWVYFSEKNREKLATTIIFQWGWKTDDSNKLPPEQ